MTLAQHSISVPVPGLEEITGSLEGVVSIEYPRMKTKCLMSRHRKSPNIYNQNSVCIQQMHWKILIQILTIILKTVQQEKNPITFFLFFFPPTFYMWRKIYVSCIVFKKILT